MKKVLAFLGLFLTQQVFAGDSAIGQWKTIDEKTNKAKSIVKIYQNADGTLSGKVVKLLKNPGAVCKYCKGSRKGKAIEGMTIMWGLKKKGDGWENGKIIDPESGKEYTVDIKVTNGGKSLKVTGWVLMFSRSQTWKRN